MLMCRAAVWLLPGVCRTGPQMEEHQSCSHILLRGGDEEQVEPGRAEALSRLNVSGFFFIYIYIDRYRKNPVLCFPSKVLLLTL